MRSGRSAGIPASTYEHAGIQVEVGTNDIELFIPLDDGQDDLGFEFCGVLFFGMMVTSYLI